MSDTPRTDASSHGLYSVPADFARQLERELNEALEHQEMPYHTCAGRDCRNKTCQLRQERDQLRAELELAVNCVELLREIANNGFGDEADENALAAYDKFKQEHP